MAVILENYIVMYHQKLIQITFKLHIRWADIIIHQTILMVNKSNGAQLF